MKHSEVVCHCSLLCSTNKNVTAIVCKTSSVCEEMCQPQSGFAIKLSGVSIGNYQAGAYHLPYQRKCSLFARCPLPLKCKNTKPVEVHSMLTYLPLERCVSLLSFHLPSLSFLLTYTLTYVVPFLCLKDLSLSKDMYSTRIWQHSKNKESFEVS